MGGPSPERRHELNERYRTVLERVCATLFRIDPMGIADGNPHVDEYSSEAQRILARADEAKDPEGLAGIVRDVFAAEFGGVGARAGVRFEDIAQDLWPTIQDLKRAGSS